MVYPLPKLYCLSLDCATMFCDIQRAFFGKKKNHAFSPELELQILRDTHFKASAKATTY